MIAPRSVGLLALVAGVAFATPAFVQAQGGGAPASDDGTLTIRAARRDTIVAATTVTAAFTVNNFRGDTVLARTRIEAPADWTVLTGGVPFDVAPQSSEMLMVSIAVPTRARAGTYPVRVWLTSAQNPRGIMDSVVVLVAPRRGLDLALLERPGYVVSGRGYEATFSVRNRGNTATTVRVAGRASHSVVTVSDTLLPLAADESRVLRVSALTRSGLQAASDDVLELRASELGLDETAHASARTTVVPEPSRRIEEYQRLPTRVHLRAGTSDGVSPFEVYGNGRLIDGGSLNLDFLFRGPTGPFSAFGERDEYRAELRGPSWRARVGDQLFMLSSLTGSGQPGFGAGADGTRGRISFGAYAQQFRRSLDRGTETGAFVSAEAAPDIRLGLNVVDRAGLLAGRIASATGSIDREIFGAWGELARSASTGGAGLAHTARVHVGRPDLSLDVGHRGADRLFAGAQRGARHMYFTSHVGVRDGLAFNLSGSRQHADLGQSLGVPYLERFDIGSVSTTLFQQITLEAGAVRRATTVVGATQAASQRTLGARTDQDLGGIILTLDAEGGSATPAGAARSVLFSDLSLALRRSAGFGTVGAYVERYSGGGVTGGIDPTVTVGGDASVRVAAGMHLTFMSYATRARRPGAEWHSQLDGRVSYTLRNGRSISLRTRLMGGGALTEREKAVAYLEYGIPFALPVSKLRTTGRVYGRVVDAISGGGVANALVRLGPQVAITDRDGQVAFGGVPGGEHRLSMSQETSFADAVFVGDPTLRVDSLRESPTTFTLAIARSARVNIEVRRFAVARTGVAGAADSLADAGPLSNATLMLTSGRDTLYRTSSAAGRATFGDIPPGEWVVSIRGDAPAHHRFEPDRLELTLGPGEVKELGFRLLPRRREVQIIGDDAELRPEQAAPKGQTPATGARVIKPSERIKQ